MNLNDTFCLSCLVDTQRTTSAAKTLIIVYHSSSEQFVRFVCNTSNPTGQNVHVTYVRPVEHDGVPALRSGYETNITEVGFL